ncbi:MAG: redoxin domain-containing protein [Armatimonadia bacterium]|nr:redoxin domain-containing protein [Armatimonadia bacterium]
MKMRSVLTVCIITLLAGSAAFAQTCDYMAVGKNMESAAARGDWEAAFGYADEIIAAQPDDLSALSSQQQYWLGAAYMYKMAQTFEMAQEGLEGERADQAAAMSGMVLTPPDVRTISHGREVELTDYLAQGKTVVFDFYSKYCPPCMRIAPRIERVAQTRDDVVLVKVDINRPDVEGIDWQSPVAQQYGIRGIPHFKIYGPDGEMQAEGGAARSIVNGWIAELDE